MRRLGYAVLGLAFAACTPSEEETPVTEPADSAVDSVTVDSTAPETLVRPDTSEELDTEPTPDSAAADSIAADSIAADSIAADSVAADTTVADTAVADTAVADTAVADTAMPDTAVADVASDAPPGVCGAAPHLLIDPLSAAALSAGSMTPVTVTANICPATTVVVNIGESKTMSVPKGAAFYFIGTQTGSLPTFSNEYNVNPAVPLAKLPYTMGMWGTGIPTTVANPAWDPSTMAFFYVNIGTVKSGSTAPCDSKGGITIAVTGHPEAVIKYGGGGTSTGTGGDAQAWGTIVTTGTSAAPEYTTLTATKTGCTLTYGGAAGAFFLTGRVPFARGTATMAGGFDISN